MACRLLDEGAMSLGHDRILICDDDRNQRSMLTSILSTHGYHVQTAVDGREALEAYPTLSPHLVITEVRLPCVTGLELLHRIRALPDPASVVVLTGFGDISSVVEALRDGATEYLTKPLDERQLLVVVERALDAQRAETETRRLRLEVTGGPARRELVGTSPSMRRLTDVIGMAASSRATVLITGESGTGKELVADAIHRRSSRASGPLVKVHCAALAESLLESELFGHERGSFTGAAGRRVGRFEIAHGGTIFLDEIGEISPAVQVKLLRILQDQQFERVGGNETVGVDARIIAATNRNLPRMVKEGRFREDLFYRLDVLSIATPALRDRPEDIPLLAHRFLARHTGTHRRNLRGFTPEALDALVHYAWPGNIRELENAVEHAVVLTSGGDEIGVATLPEEIVAPRPAALSTRPSIPGATLAELERYAILRTLEFYGGSTSRAARVLGISARKIQYRLQTYSSAPRSGVDALAREVRT